MKRVVGLVLAGGRSRRFGTEKAAAEINGRPMIAYAYDVLERSCEAVAINAPEASFAAAWGRGRGLATIPDAPGDPDGPLSGIKAGLLWARQHRVPLLASVPCDTPQLPGDLVSRLVQELGVSRASFATTPHGAQPLCSVWSTDCLGTLEPSLQGAHPSVREILTALCARPVMFADEAAFCNVNTPTQLDDVVGGR